MKTTHELARELLAMTDIPVCVEGWCLQDGAEVSVMEMEEDGKAILIADTANCQPLDDTHLVVGRGRLVTIDLKNGKLLPHMDVPEIIGNSQ